MAHGVKAGFAVVGTITGVPNSATNGSRGSPRCRITWLTHTPPDEVWSSTCFVVTRDPVNR